MIKCDHNGRLWAEDGEMFGGWNFPMNTRMAGFIGWEIRLGSPQLCAPMSPSARPCAGTQTTKQLCAIMLDTQSAMSRIASLVAGFDNA
jgi:hypothetical protein